MSGESVDLLNYTLCIETDMKLKGTVGFTVSIVKPKTNTI